MLAKDILRLVLLVLFVAFALRSGSRIRLPDSVQINSPGETEDKETPQLLQRMKDARERVSQEPKGFENKNRGKEFREFSKGVNSSAGTFIMIIALLLILL